MAGLNGGYFRAAERLASCSSHESLHKALMEEAELFGAEFYHYCARLPAIERRHPPLIMSGYPKEWLSHYLRSGYEKNDPTLIHCRSSCSPEPWSEVHFKANLELYREMREAGLRHGTTFPIHGLRGESGAFCLASSGRGAESSEALEHFAALVPRIHERVVAIESARGPKSYFALPELTPREKEFLALMAVGKNNQDIAQIMGISYRTSTFHQQNLLAKFGCSHRYQVIAIAACRGLVEAQ